MSLVHLQAPGIGVFDEVAVIELLSPSPWGRWSK